MQIGWLGRASFRWRSSFSRRFGARYPIVSGASRCCLFGLVGTVVGLHAHGLGRIGHDALRGAPDRWNFRSEHQRGAGLSRRHLDAGEPRQGDGASWCSFRTGICVWPGAWRMGERCFQLRRTDVHRRGAFADEFLFRDVLFCRNLVEPVREAPRSEPIFPNLFDHVERTTYAWSVASYFLVIVGFSMMTALFALLLFHRFGLDALHTGYVLAGIGILGVIIQGGLIGRLVKRFGEAPVALAGAVLMCAGLCALALSSGVGWMIAATAAVGIGNSLLMPTLSALASRSAESSWQGRALGCHAVERQSGALGGTDAGRSASERAASSWQRGLRSLAVVGLVGLPLCRRAGGICARRARCSLRRGEQRDDGRCNRS